MMQTVKDAAEDKIMEILGPLALAKCEVSIYDVAMAFFKYGAEYGEKSKLRGLWFHEDDGSVRTPTTRDI